MLSAGMFSAFAARIAVRSRGLPSGSPPPFFAAMVISLIRRVNILPRLASSAPFLCLIVAHLEWPDINPSVSLKCRCRSRLQGSFRTHPPLRVYHRGDADLTVAGRPENAFQRPFRLRLAACECTREKAGTRRGLRP